jgi:hypothetical protein
VPDLRGWWPPHVVAQKAEGARGRLNNRCTGNNESRGEAALMCASDLYFGCTARHGDITGLAEGFRLSAHAGRRLKLIRMTIAPAHAKSHATSATSRFEVNIKNHAAKLQQRKVRSFQPAPRGAVSARARAIGARTTARNPKIRRPSLSRLSVRGPPLASRRSALTAMTIALPICLMSRIFFLNCNRDDEWTSPYAATPASSDFAPIRRASWLALRGFGRVPPERRRHSYIIFITVVT